MLAVPLFSVQNVAMASSETAAGENPNIRGNGRHQNTVCLPNTSIEVTYTVVAANYWSPTNDRLAIEIKCDETIKVSYTSLVFYWADGYDEEFGEHSYTTVKTNPEKDKYIQECHCHWGHMGWACHYIILNGLKLEKNGHVYKCDNQIKLFFVNS